jgi:hypothetical protein
MPQQMYCSGAVMSAKNRRFNGQNISLIMVKMKMLTADWSEKSCKTFQPLKRSGLCCWYRNAEEFGVTLKYLISCRILMYMNNMSYITEPSQSRFGSLQVRVNTVRLDQRHRTAVIDQNSIHEKIKSRFSWGKACYRSAQNLLYSSLLPQKGGTR